MGVTAAIATAAALQAGTTVYTQRKQKKAVQEAEAARQKEADRLFAQQEKEFKAQESRFEEQRVKQEEAESQAESTQKRDAAARRRRKKEKGSQGRASTILTGPQGVEDGSAQGGRTLLGV
jgi:uncharacterized protein HemX